MSAYISGQFIRGNGAPFHSVDPLDAHVIWEGFASDGNNVRDAVTAASQAFNAWAALDISTRANYLEAFANEVARRREALAVCISQESGKPLWEAMTEVNAVIAKIKVSIDAYHTRTTSTAVHTPDAEGLIRYKPLGVIAVLGPFNFPAHLSNGHIIPALLAGNTIVYKPSELTPWVAMQIMACWDACGLPEGVINCIQGGADTGAALLDEAIQGVFFTGSYTTGLAIHQKFAQRPEVLVALEMGGNNPLIIGNIATPKAAVYHTLISAFITAGQRCSCARRLYVPRTPQGEAFLSELLLATQELKVGGFRENPEPFMGPVIRASHAEKHLLSQAKLQDLGGKSLVLMRALRANSGLLSPGIIDMTGAATPLPDEEIFGPLLQLIRYDTFDEALMLANQTRYGLAAGLFSDDSHQYHAFYEHINAGIINWNRPTTGAVGTLPFGGIGASGNHRPSAYFAADYCAYPIASLVLPVLQTPLQLLPGICL